ncbi:hypothetical protein HDU85_005885 [Gaertneriomyces sp. JEL0708]|nr:hypothetical protein HDU85_005885 [Gaertneriomyces sp. JEL0708]
MVKVGPYFLAALTMVLGVAASDGIQGGPPDNHAANAACKSRVDIAAEAELQLCYNELSRDPKYDPWCKDARDMISRHGYMQCDEDHPVRGERYWLCELEKRINWDGKCFRDTKNNTKYCVGRGHMSPAAKARQRAFLLYQQ